MTTLKRCDGLFLTACLLLAATACGEAQSPRRRPPAEPAALVEPSRPTPSSSSPEPLAREVFDASTAPRRPLTCGPLDAWELALQVYDRIVNIARQMPDAPPVLREMNADALQLNRLAKEPSQWSGRLTVGEGELAVIAELFALEMATDPTSPAQKVWNVGSLKIALFYGDEHPETIGVAKSVELAISLVAFAYDNKCGSSAN
ncbi:MAG: hypothetical protein AAGA56_22745 [Myxococcota bacterium]